MGMLYRIIVSNYKSFREDTELNMFPNPKRETFLEHVYKGGKTPVVKMCAIYGANGAGKSNLIEAFRFLKVLIADREPYINGKWLGEWYLSNRFRLPVEEGKPTELLMEYETGGHAYIYQIAIDEGGIRSEELLISGLGKKRNVRIFCRNRKENTLEFRHGIVSGDIKKVFERQIREDSSLTVLGANYTGKLTEDENLLRAFGWFRQELDVVRVSRKLPLLIKAYKEDAELQEYLEEALTKMGLEIKQMGVKETDYERWKGSHEEAKSIIDVLDRSTFASWQYNDVPLYLMETIDGRKIMSEFMFRQEGWNGYEGDMDIKSQSDGTVRLLTLVPAIYNADKKGKTMVVDEIDRGIHPMVVKQLVKMFCEHNTTGQLIFTTHETALLNQSEMLRPDEVWFAEKREGQSTLYSLNDFKVHNSINIENGYLQGRFGAIPFIGKL